MDTGLSNKTAVVTGSGRGIGRGIACKLAGEGASVAVWDIDGKTAQETVAQIRDAGGKAIVCVGDAADDADIARLLAQTHGEFGPVTVLVNNAAVISVSDFTSITPQELDRILRINLRGPFRCAQAIVPDMLAAGWGRIINISSSSAQGGAAGRVHYAASKGGLIGLTKALAMEYVARNITVNHIPPGLIETPMSGRSREEYAVLAAASPMKRVGSPEDVAAACVFLASAAASYITGQTLSVNGGRYLF